MPTYPETPLYRAIISGAFPIIVSLPRHDIDLAKAALDGGAGAIKVHLNAHHRASGTTFGNYTEERPFLEALAKLGAPMLVMAGQETVPTLGEMNAMADLGFEGFNVYVDHLQPHLLDSRLRPMPALSSTSTDEDISRLSAIPGAMIEASIMTFDDYGKPLTEADIARYEHIAKLSSAPIIAPSQKKFTPADMPAMQAAGIAAPLLGVIVTGSTPQEILSSISAFAKR
ncbi:hypothetical protein [Devosia aurantiaca]|uniref:Thiamine phosphate synthase/TenI domain-containing protein n=1 Tax=Devosia aurantiaca TaxID=2714858 RepID=A0A6M1SQ65_9HYPH|nr:hypothetical protein [Devosia aurantiaca]NGP17345.1 hypothetical protein [Devosia aurantiaca]